VVSHTTRVRSAGIYLCGVALDETDPALAASDANG